MLIIRILGYTFLQIALIIAFFALGKAIYLEFESMKLNIGRGIYWHYFILIFGILSLFGNSILENWRQKFTLQKRLILWAFLVLTLLLYSLPSISTIPLSAIFINLCAVSAITISELVHARLTSVSSGLERASEP